MTWTKKRILYTSAVAVIIVFSTTFSILMTLERNNYRNYLQSDYSRSMYDLITYVDNIRSQLTKASVVGSREQRISVMDEIFRYSTEANDKVSSLPVEPQVSGSTMKFISQVGDFARSINRSVMTGRDLTKDDYTKIERLKNESINLEAQLNDALSDLNQGRVRWGEIRRKMASNLNRNTGDMVSSKFQEIQKQVVSYPALIYDGPFSDNVQEITPRVNSYSKISKADAINAVKKILGEDKVSQITENVYSSKTRIDAYSFDVTMKGRQKGEVISCDISKSGGRLINLLDNRSVGKTSKTTSQAASYGEAFLNKLGYGGMVSTYILKYDNIAVISYVYQQKNVYMYPDQVKLKVALDDGTIVGVEAEKYLISHIENRYVHTPKVSESTARSKVNKNLKINSSRLSIIPTETNSEVFCYEYSGTYRGDNFLVYINADTGFEQKILQIINTPNGQLTM